MTIESLLIYILLLHFLADFALQTHGQATGKGEGKSFFNKWLFYHVSTYSLVWLIGSYILMNDYRCLIFFGITFVSHYVTDWFTSRIGKPFWHNNDYHNGFVVVGFDQILHYLQLYFTFKFLLS